MIDLRLGDCLEVMKTIESGSIDAIITDPPYGTTACKWDSVIDTYAMWHQLNRIIKPNGAIVLFGSEPFSSMLRMSNIKNYKYDWVWNKVKPSGHLNAKKRPMLMVENICIFNNHFSNYNPIMIPQKPRLSKNYLTNKKDQYGSEVQVEKIIESKHPNQIITVSNANQKGKQHPTQKPIKLMEYLIKTYTKEMDWILDFTMGSGSTGVAAKNTNRNFIGIEKDEDYFNIAKKRIEENPITLFS